ncbi:unnamed protein product [Diatraea saccharalis]|uniref:Uncharacterized protein n=1 Tax=Diatraea saccharalis TaxID=40085 RepID=A0A9N9R1D1_9NEOP|nr:unnamed protein product [Diatraea saccharalis]
MSGIRGRFMMSSPESVVSGGGAGGGAGARAAGARMPLCAACPCRAPHAAPALLQRLHIQPVPGGPIFVPMPAGSPPIKLSASAYWVLRFPRVYCDERGVLPRPRSLPAAATAAPPPAPGTLIAPIFGLQD